ncbi:hypothetical protein, partial [uncultured Ruminococcus sp.]
MKKRTKKVFSFGVAALMAISALPFGAMSVSASVADAQTANGGTPYNFVLNEDGTSSQEINISKDDVAAGNVTKHLNLYIQSDNWAEDNYISSVTLNWCATKDATLADGGSIDNKIYYENVFKADEKDAEATDKTLPDGSTVNTLCQIYSLAPMRKTKNGYRYADPKCSATIRKVACDRIFGADLQVVGENKVAFDISYYASADDYNADKANKSSDHITKETITCDVLTGDDGVPYITYDYISQGAEVAANYQKKTAVQQLPLFGKRTVTNSSGKECVPDINSYYYWGFTGSSSEKTSFVLGDSMALPFTSFDVVIPQGTEEGTYYVQICSRDVDKNIVPLKTAADFDKVRAEQVERRKNGQLEDMSTCIQGKKSAESYALPQDASKAVVKIVVGDGAPTTSATTTTAAPTTTTTTDAQPSDGPQWKIDTVDVAPGDPEVAVNISQTGGVGASTLGGALYMPEATQK